MIRIQHISKRFDDTEALSDLSLEIGEGELFGCIGPDGAGKTTLFRILVTLLLPSEGEAWINDLHVVDDYRKIRRRLGYMPGRFSLYQDLSVEENLRFFASVFGTTVDANYDWIRPVYSQIEPFKDRLAGALSGGMKQKLALSCALIHRPEVLVLDEPTTGVDAVSREEFWDNLASIKASGVTILVSTPYMDEATQCDRIALMQDGRLLDVNTPAAIARAFPHPLLAVKSSRRHALLEILRAHPHAHSVYPFGEYAHFADSREAAHEHTRYAMEMASYLSERGFDDVEVRLVRPGIEDAFMEMMTP